MFSALTVPEKVLAVAVPPRVMPATVAPVIVPSATERVTVRFVESTSANGVPV